MRKALKKLNCYTGRVMRYLRRHLHDIPESSLRDRIIAKLALVSQLLHQAPKGSDKIYALNEPEDDCISKGKARVRYEFGCKVSVATTLDEGFVVGMRSVAGNPYDGHTLKEALEQVTILTDQRPDLAVIDRGHRLEATRVLISGTRRGLTPKLIADLRRRSANEAETGHVKTDGRLSRCPLKGTIGDALFATLCACGHNIRKILAHLRAWLAWIFTAILNAVYHHGRQCQPPTSPRPDYSRRTN
jgi:IS5 family transposase